MVKKAKCAIIIQARMSSTRFPGKIRLDMCGMPLVEYLYNRCKKSLVKDVLIAISDDKSDDVLYDYCISKSIPVMRGSLDNVLKRYIQAAESIGARYIIRVCGDTPFVDIHLFDVLLKALINENLDYAGLSRATCASGFYSEAVTLQALKKVAALTKDKEALEHVTKFIIDNKDKFSARFIDVDLNPDFVKNKRLTIDYPGDLMQANIIAAELKDKFLFTSKEVLSIVSKKVV